MLDRLEWFRQSAYRWTGDGLTVYIDPWGVTDPSPADVIFLTHAHDDHFRPEDIAKIQTDRTQIVAPHDVARELSGNVTPVAPGDTVDVAGIKGQAVPAYNIVEHRLDAHPKAKNWVGYILDLGGTTIYHAGDTDHLLDLEEITAEVAFLPIGGGPFTMDPREAADLTRAMNPQIAVPMHYAYIVGSPSDAERFKKEAEPVDVRILEPTNPFELD